jgi:hypothetical protein
MKTGMVIATLLMTASTALGQVVSVQYDVDQLGAVRWEYTYTVTNNTLAPGVEELTLWFDYGLFENLAVTTPSPLSGEWDEIVVQPEPLIHDDGFYDALALAAPIDVGESVHGLAVAFDWLGQGEPGAQPFEIVDPDSFEVLASGVTPEPGSILVLLIGGLACRRRRQHE